MQYLRLVLLGWLCFCAMLATAQAADEPYRLHIPRIEGNPDFDDFSGMSPVTALAHSMAKVDGFVQRLPGDGSPPSQRTEVYLGYDESQLYAIFLAFDSQPELVRATMSSREVIDGDDSVELTVDTFNDQRTAYTFRVTPLGLQWDARWSEGAGNRSGFDTTLEAVWDSDGQLTDQGYMVRIAVPMASLRFPNGHEQLWRVQLGRQIPRLSEETYWPPYSLRYEGRLNQTALLSGIEGVQPGSNMMLIPYVFARAAQVLDPRAAGGPAIGSTQEYTMGLDSKFVFNDAWVLDLTLNPDFSQVESDEPAVTVNERFEVMFPERRPFFVENADFFSTDSNLVFTRRIVDPEAGLRFTGRSNGWGFGAIVMNDVAPGQNRDVDHPLYGENAMVTILRGFRDISGQDRIGLLFTDRQLADGYNRVASVDGRFKLTPNWVTTVQVIGTDTAPVGGAPSFTGAQRNVQIDRSGRTFRSHVHYISTNHGFRSDLGFGNRQYRPDTHGPHGNAQLTFFPETPRMISWSPRMGGVYLKDSRNNTLFEEVSPSLRFTFPTSFINVGYNRTTETLRPQDFAGLPAITPYDYGFWTASYSNSMLASLIVDVSHRRGTALNLVPARDMLPAVADTTRTELSLLWRPIDRLRINSTYLNTTLDLPGGNKVFSNDIMRSTWNYQFNKELSLRFIGQYDDTNAGPATRLQTSKNLNFDLLLRYVLNPLSAFYVGYNSNSRNFDIIEDVETGERELVLANVLRRDGEQFFVKFSYMSQY